VEAAVQPLLLDLVVLEPRKIRAALIDRIDAFSIDVEANRAKSPPRKLKCQRQTDVAETNHADPREPGTQKQQKPLFGT
jgi:hypothetical protein